MSTSIAPLPRVPETYAPLPGVPESVAPLPRVRETVLPAGWIPYIPPRIDTASSSEETSIADVLGVHYLNTDSTSEDTSSVGLVPIQYLVVGSSTEETSAADVSDARPLDAVSESEESSSVDAVAVLVPVSATEESSSITPGFETVSSSEESSSLNVELIGVLNPVSLSEETSSVDIKTFAPSSMTKNGLQDLGSSTSEVQITGWLPDTTAYPGSTVNTNQLVVQTSGDGLTVRAYIQIENTSFLDRQLTLRLRLADNTQIATSGTVAFVGDEIKFVTAEATGLTLAQGALIRATAQQSNGNAFDVLANSASYVRVFKP